MTKRLPIAELVRAKKEIEAAAHGLEPLGATGDLSPEGNATLDEFLEAIEYLTKWIANEELAAKVRRVMRGEGDE